MFNIPKTKAEKSLEMTSLIFISGMFVLSIYVWNDLPDKIPFHYTFLGEPDRWGGKFSIFIWPIVGFCSATVLTVLSKAPHMLNYPIKVTKENAVQLYAETRKMLVVLNFEISAILTFIQLDIVLQAFEKTGISHWMIPVFFMLMIGTIGFFIYRMVQLK